MHRTRLRHALRLLLVIGGMLVTLGGTVFTLQGFGVLGPSSSFMVNDADWIRNGLVIASAGLGASYIGLRINGRS